MATLGALVFAGEVVYTLPYFLRRDYSAAMRSAMDLTQAEFGYVSSLFGVLALLCYGPSGLLADRFQPKGLLALSTFATAAIGCTLAFFPSYVWLLLVFALLGISSILPLWAPLIKATRLWGSARGQGLAFGLLDGGRGLVAAILASTSVFFFQWGGSPAAGLRNVILYYCGACALGTLVVWRFVPRGEPVRGSARDDDEDTGRATEESETSATRGADDGRAAGPFPTLASNFRTTALLSAVLFFAYASYWGTFYLSSYAVEVYGMSHSQGARLTSSVEWLRPPLAVTAGLLADRFGARRSVLWGFSCTALGYFSLAFLSPQTTPAALFVVQAAFVSAATFALRGVYYALLQESRVPLLLTGTVVGIVSVIGYCPDVLAPAVAGNLLDQLPGQSGYRLWFALLGGLGVGGLLCAARLTIGSTDDGPRPARA